jgi:hypothetical protein
MPSRYIDRGVPIVVDKCEEAGTSSYNDRADRREKKTAEVLPILLVN